MSLFKVIYVSLIFAFIPFLSSTAEERLPNIIYILADDLGYGDLGCYGQKKFETPNIDRIAAEGIRFTQHYSGNAVCAPSRCNLMTGKHPGHAYIRENGVTKERRQVKEGLYKTYFPGQVPIPDSEVTIAEVLKEKGYATAAIGKWGLGYEGSSGDPNKQGFDFFYGYICQRHAHNHYPRFLWKNGKKELLEGNDRKATGKIHSQDKFTEHALHFINDNKENPFFLYLPLAIPHVPIQVDDSFVAKYREKISEEEFEKLNRDRYVQHPRPRAGYAAMIHYIDRDIGLIMKRIEELGLDKDTLIMFSSDNGPAQMRLGGTDTAFFESKKSFRGEKGTLYEGGIRIPLVARWPEKIKSGTVSDHISAFWDVFPTIAELAGAEVSDAVDGISFASTLLGKEQKQHEYLYWEFHGYRGQQAVRMGDWKALRQEILEPKNPEPLKIELYNLASDIAEAENIASQHPEIVEKMRKIMVEARTVSAISPFGPVDRVMRSR